VTILAPADRSADRWPADSFELLRSKSFLRNRYDRFQASIDLNDSIAGICGRVSVGISLISYFVHALVLSRRSDAVLSHWLVPCGLAGSLSSKIMRKPHIAIEHSGAVHLLSRIRGGRLLARFIARHSDRLVFVSEDLKSRFLRLVPTAANRTHVIRMGVGANASSRGKSNQKQCVSDPQDSSDKRLSAEGQLRKGARRHVLFIGRLTDIKGVDVLLRAMTSLSGTTLVIAGDGPRRRELEQLAQSLPVDAIFCGRVGAGERARLLDECDVVAVPSLVMPDGRCEGTPVVCLEAMAAGRPVVASKAGGLAEIIDDGRNGLLFEPGDHASLARNLERLLDDDEFRGRIGREARATAAAFDWGLIGSSFEQLVLSVLTDDTIHGNCRIETERAGA
jgi:glycosyltransferase involved in cell wall biosynthesis